MIVIKSVFNKLQLVVNTKLLLGPGAVFYPSELFFHAHAVFCTSAKQATTCGAVNSVQIVLPGLKASTRCGIFQGVTRQLVGSKTNRQARGHVNCEQAKS